MLDHSFTWRTSDSLLHLQKRRFLPSQKTLTTFPASSHPLKRRPSSKGCASNYPRIYYPNTAIQINSVPLPAWRYLSHRRLQTYPSPLTPQNTLLASPLPLWLSEPILPRLLSLPLSDEAHKGHIFSNSPHKAPNHVLINEYSPAQGIFPHEDGSAYYPVVATISLGSHIVLDIYAKKGDESGEREAKPRWRILQEPRSLLITTGELYRDFLHGIMEIEVDKDLNEMCLVNWNLLGLKEDFEGGERKRGTRVSLTFRDVLKMKNLGKSLSFLGRGRS